VARKVGVLTSGDESLDGVQVAGASSEVVSLCVEGLSFDVFEETELSLPEQDKAAPKQTASIKQRKYLWLGNIPSPLPACDHLWMFAQRSFSIIYFQSLYPIISSIIKHHFEIGPCHSNGWLKPLAGPLKF
jgi:hypothetical protein